MGAPQLAVGHHDIYFKSIFHVDDGDWMHYNSVTRKEIKMAQEHICKNCGNIIIPSQHLKRGFVYCDKCNDHFVTDLITPKEDGSGFSKDEQGDILFNRIVYACCIIIGIFLIVYPFVTRAIVKNSGSLLYTFAGMAVIMLAIYFCGGQIDHIKYLSEKRALGRGEKLENERFLSQMITLQDAYALSPEDFEILIQLLFEKLGFEATRTQYTADGGIDLKLQKDGKLELVQCKRYKGTVSVQTIREFYGVMIDNRVSKGYIITTGHFTLPGKRFAEGKGIHLIDGTELAEMLQDNKIENEKIDEFTKQECQHDNEFGDYCSKCGRSLNKN